MKRRTTKTRQTLIPATPTQLYNNKVNLLERYTEITFLWSIYVLEHPSVSWLWVKYRLLIYLDQDNCTNSKLLVASPKILNKWVSDNEIIKQVSPRTRKLLIPTSFLTSAADKYEYIPVNNFVKVSILQTRSRED